MGLDHGRESRSPSWSLVSRNPVSSLAALENGGVLTSPCNHVSGLSSAMQNQYMSHPTYCQYYHATVIQVPLPCEIAHFCPRIQKSTAAQAGNSISALRFRCSSNALPLPPKSHRTIACSIAAVRFPARQNRTTRSGGDFGVLFFWSIFFPARPHGGLVDEQKKMDNCSLVPRYTLDSGSSTDKVTPS
jgi:hypothetical protein